MRKYGVARQTVQNAFDLLRGEGLIDSRTGAGTFVRHRPNVLRLARNRSSRGYGPPDARVEIADARVAATLGLPVGAELMVCDEVVRDAGTPVQLVTSYRPNRTIQPALRHIEYVSTRPANPTEADALDLVSAAPVLCVMRIGYDGAGDATELHDLVLSGERYQLVYELTTD